MKQLLEAGVHFGHQAKRDEPKNETLYLHREKRNPRNWFTQIFKENWGCLQASRNIAADGGKVLSVGTKKQSSRSSKRASWKIWNVLCKQTTDG